MSHWEKYTCITFVERDPTEHENYIEFTRKNCGCCSRIGMVGDGQTKAVDCADGYIAHELGHAVGFIHEHDRPDRDEYIDVVENNSNLYDWHSQFGKYDDEEIDTLGERYDFESILHYRYTTFSKYRFLEHEIQTKGGATWDDKWWTLANISTILPKR